MQGCTGTAWIPSKRKAWFAWSMYDWANSAYATVILTGVFPVYFASLVPQEGARLCMLGYERVIPAAALWGYMVSITMTAVAVSAPVLGARADCRNARRRYLMVCCLAGAMATSLLALPGKGQYLFAGVLFCAATFCFAVGNVFYNSFLPLLARGRELDRLSARGFAFGYLGGGLMLGIVFVLIWRHEVFHLTRIGAATRLGLLLTGLWWGLFSIPAFGYLRERGGRAPGGRSFEGVRECVRTLREFRGFKDLARFLIAFVFYHDGIQTIILVSAIFAREELGLSQLSISGCFLMIQFVAIPGSLLFGRLAEQRGTRNALMTSLILFTMVTIYAFFIQSQWQFWLAGFFVALVQGGSQALSRSLYGSLIPHDRNAQFFGFYSTSARFSSIFGPLIFALIIDVTHSLRYAVLSVTLFFVVGMVLLQRVNVERGRDRVGWERSGSACPRVPSG